jgi:hypothetical protein
VEPLSKELIDLLTYLLPGFIAAAILYGLTPSPRPQPFERIVQALIFTVFIQVLVLATRGVSSWVADHYFSLGAWTEQTRLVWSVVLAIALGLALARCSNFDTMHRVLRRLRITYQTSYSSEWYGVFAKSTGYVVLHLSGERRLYGWPEEWPSTSREGHFAMTQAEWLTDDGSTPLNGVERILIDVSEVVMVEFMGVRQTEKEEQQSGRQKGADTGSATKADR